LPHCDDLYIASTVCEAVDSRPLGAVDDDLKVESRLAGSDGWISPAKLGFPQRDGGVDGRDEGIRVPGSITSRESRRVDPPTRPTVGLGLDPSGDDKVRELPRE
jgi:hypothetical protein